jgi:hypothetical protein
MKKIFFFITLIFLSSLFINKFLDHYYKKFWNATFEKLDTVFKDTTSRDIVFVGDSRVQFGINPFYIDSITNKNSYNIGMGGAPINEITFLTKAWLNNHKPPKIFVVSIGLTGLLDGVNYFSNPCYYLSYLQDSLAYNTLSNLKYHTFLNKILPISKYTVFDEFQKTSIIRSIQGEQFLKNNGVAYKGFINNDIGTTFNERMSFSIKDVGMKNEKWVDTLLLKLSDLVKIIKSHNCEIIFIYPPNLNLEMNKETLLFLQNVTGKIENIANIEKIKILKFDNDSSFKKSLFQDSRHLNINGSILYSKKLGIALKEILK